MGFTIDADNICSIRHYFTLPCKDCIYYKTEDCKTEKERAKNGNSKKGYSQESCRREHNQL